jgi:hypothetical protein
MNRRYIQIYEDIKGKILEHHYLPGDSLKTTCAAITVPVEEAFEERWIY